MENIYSIQNSCWLRASLVDSPTEQKKKGDPPQISAIYIT